MRKKNLFGTLLIVATIGACSGYSGGKKEESRKGAQAAKDCEQDDKNDEGASGTDPWGDAYLTQSEVDWQELKSMIEEKCVSCHAGYDSLETAKEKADAYITRMDLDEDASGFMPKDGTKVSLEDRQKFIAWKYAGFPESKDDPGSSKFDDEDDDEDDSQRSIEDDDC